MYSKVDNYLEKTEIVHNIMKMIFDGKLDDEIEKRNTVETIFSLLIDQLKESDDKHLLQFHQMDWNFPENPREIDINIKSLKIPGKCEKTFDVKVFLTPNFIGKFSKNLKLKLVMSNLSSCWSVEETIINIPIIYECQPPELVIHNAINSIVGYAESEICLEILVENYGVDGFFIISGFQDTQIEIKCEQEKFHIKKKSKKIVNLVVKPFRSGLMVKYVNLTVLGSNRKFPISIECKSLPPDIIVLPQKVLEDDLDVLVKHATRIFIENRSPTKARLFFRLEHENKAFEIEPKGGILASKQSLMVNLSKFFTDPGTYRDVLVVEVINSKVIVSLHLFIKIS